MTYRMSLSTLAIFAMMLGLPAVPANASGGAHCTVTASAEWKSPADVKAAAEALGYKVRRVKVDDGCYEAYAFNRSGQRVEVYFHPVSLKIVKEELDD